MKEAAPPVRKSMMWRCSAVATILMVFPFWTQAKWCWLAEFTVYSVSWVLWLLFCCTSNVASFGVCVIDHSLHSNRHLIINITIFPCLSCCHLLNFCWKLYALHAKILFFNVFLEASVGGAYAFFQFTVRASTAGGNGIWSQHVLT